jgi:hypothetical protein
MHSSRSTEAGGGESRSVSFQEALSKLGLTGQARHIARGSRLSTAMSATEFWR